MTQLPECIATAVGKLFLENAMLREALAEAQTSPPPGPAPDPAEPPQ